MSEDAAELRAEIRRLKTELRFAVRMIEHWTAVVQLHEALWQQHLTQPRQILTGSLYMADTWGPKDVELRLRHKGEETAEELFNKVRVMLGKDVRITIEATESEE